MKIPFYIFFVIALSTNVLSAQHKYEREFRIKKSQMPTEALQLLERYLEDAKRLKYYKEIDTSKTTYEAKFKKDKLWYGIEFDATGSLEDIKITIAPLDIPSDVLANISTYFKKSFDKHRVKKIQQQYLATAEEDLKTTFRNAFQNLLIPSLNYEIIVSGKKINTI